MNEKRGLSTGFIVLFVIMGLVIITLLIFLIVLFKGGKNYGDYYSERISDGTLVNPALDLSLEEAVSQFNEDFIYYMLYSIKAYNLHDPLFSNDHPKLEFHVEEIIYSAEIKKGIMDVQEGGIEEEDIIIRTTREEAVKMLQDENYVSESFSTEATTIEMIAGNLELASKGYITLYEELTGESITGAAVFNMDKL